MNKKPESWEDVLYCPPLWPYAKGDVLAPAAHPTITQYGYDIQALDALPVQAGYEKPRAQSSTATNTEAKQYYEQFQVFRDVMLDPKWSARQQATECGHDVNESSYQRSESTDQENELLAEAETDEYLINASGRPRAQCSSTESSNTAVSEDYDASNGQQTTNGQMLAELKAMAGNKSNEAMRKGQSRLGPRVPQGESYTVLRILMLCGIISIIAAELFGYFIIRQMVALYEKVFIWRGYLGQLLVHMRAATSYQEYLSYAAMIDTQTGVDLEDSNTHSRYYDATLLLRVTKSMRKMRATAEQQQNKVGKNSNRDGARNAIVSLCDLLRQGTLKANAGGWENRQIWSQAYSGTTHVVKEYILEAVACIECVRESPYLSPSEKLQFFRQVARQQGRMALCLSGGAAMGWKHLGVARCLLDEAQLPRVISGTSAGSLVAALLGTHTDSELRQIIRPELVKYMTACQGSEWQRLTRWITKGYYFDAMEWAPRAQVFTRGSLTFLEAFERTGKLLNISCTPMGHRYSPRKLLNYITAPNVIIWSAVLASACIPGIMQPMMLLMKTRDGHIKPYTNSGVLWRDGSFRNDIPSIDLRASLNVQFTVVSQVNPHVALFFYDRDGSIGQPPARSYSSAWRGGFIPSAIEHMLKLDIRKWLRLLSDLNIMPIMLSQDWSFVWLQKFDGDVTILPEMRPFEYLGLLKDPTHASLAQSMRAGKIATWPKLKMIKTRQAIEDAITWGWVDSYHACIRSSWLMQSIPPNIAVEVAGAAKNINKLKRQKQQALPEPLGTISQDLDDEYSTVFQTLHYLRSQESSLGTKKLALCRRSSRSHGHKLCSTAEDDYISCSLSIAEDVWTG